MSTRSNETSQPIRLPRDTYSLHGHRDAEASLLAAYQSGKIPHAWLIGGPHGIGKATLAYRLARFVLAHPDPAAERVQAAMSLDVDRSHPVARQIAAGTHGGLLTLERTANDKGVMRTVITVDETRETISFFGSTAAVDGWRVCVVDTVDELNANAANALLKILEEPPARALLLLVSHAPARALPTIRSRCRRLMLRPLGREDILRAVSEVTSVAQDDSALAESADVAEGSVARALNLLSDDALGLRQKTAAALATLPNVDPRALHALGDALNLNDRVALSAFTDCVDRWFSERLRDDGAGARLPQLARLSEVWEKINEAARQTESFNLERKPLVFSVFGLLAEVTR